MTKITIPTSDLILNGTVSAAMLETTSPIRPHSPAMDAMLEQEFPVLDHGFIRVVDYMGNDAAVVQAARTSYGTGTKAVTEDRGLLRYLMRHYHSTPFEMCEVKLHVKLPIFVARQWVRHRMANINEYSARYSILDREFYIPEPEHLAVQSTDNKQGRSAVLEPQKADEIRQWLIRESDRSYDNYLDVIQPEDEGGHYGLARELARMNLPTNIYTQWYWKVDVHNLMNFLRLRADPHAQYEIRVYAEKILEIFKEWMPHTYEAFVDYKLNGMSLSRMEVEYIRAALAGLPTDFKEMSTREVTEFKKKMLLNL